MATEAEYEQARRDGKFLNEMLRCRDMLDPVVTGQIERGHCAGGRECYGMEPGMRKTKLVDAVRIAKTIQVIINRAVKDFHADEY